MTAHNEADSLPTVPVETGHDGGQMHLVGVVALTGTALKPVDYKLPDGKRADILGILQRAQLDGFADPFLAELEALIGRFRIFRQQDKSLQQSDSKALAHLKRAHKQLQAVISEYSAAWNYLPGQNRLLAAWNCVKALRPVRYMGTPTSRFRLPEEPDSIGRATDYLLELDKLFDIAVLPLPGNVKGGRPSKHREMDFLR